MSETFVNYIMCLNSQAQGETFKLGFKGDMSDLLISYLLAIY